MDNIKTWTGLSVEESIRMTEDRAKWRKYVHGVANPRIETAKEQNRTYPQNGDPIVAIDFVTSLHPLY